MTKSESKSDKKEETKHRFNVGLFFVICFIVAQFIIFFIFGVLFIGWKPAFGCYFASLISISLGLMWVFTATIYQKYLHAFELSSKYNKNENGTPWGDKVVFGFIFKFRIFPSQQFWFFVLLVAGVIVSLIPYQNWNGEKSVLDILIIFRKTMQLFVVDGGVHDFIRFDNCNLPLYFQDVAPEGILIYNVYFALLSVAAGLIFTFKLIFFFAKEFKAYIDYWRAHPWSDIYVMSELNEQSITLAESIFVNYLWPGVYVKDRNNNKRSDLAYYFRIYFCDVYSENKEKSAELILRAKRIGATVMKRDITEIKIKKHCKSNRFYLIGSSEEENMKQAQQICTSRETLSTKKDKELKVYIYATRPESELIIDNMHNKYEDNENGKSEAE